MPTRVLLVRDREAEEVEGFEAAVAGLEESGFRLERVEELSRALERLSLGSVDVVLLDLDLPDSRGLTTFERAGAFAPDVPIVVLTAMDDPEIGVQAVQAGAQDFLVLGQVDEDLLLRSVRHAVERHRLLSALRNLSLIDHLTGLYNRRGFMELGEQNLKLARRGGRSLTLLYVDFDGFKNINEEHGHHVGDRCLTRAADILRDAFRGSDLVARLGSDEFAVLALEAAGDDTENLASRIRNRLEEADPEGRGSLEFSVSVGTARYEDGRGRTRLDELLAEADRAVHREKMDKRGGRR